MKNIFTYLAMLMFGCLSAQWTPAAFTGEAARPQNAEDKYFKLDMPALRRQLQNAPPESSRQGVPVMIPLADGKIHTFEVHYSPSVVPSLAERYDLRGYAGTDVNDPSTSIRFSLAPDDFQATVFSNGQYSFIEPTNSEKKLYRAYQRTKMVNGKSFLCSTDESPAEHAQIEALMAARNTARNSDGKYRTMRLAMSVTGEYTQSFGGTVAGALAQINATINRVNFVFEKDFALHLILQDFPQLIYTNPATDPYTTVTGGAPAAWNLELQNTLTNTIGNAAYDIGHLFGASGGGGNAGCIGCVCVNPTTAVPRGKGSGYTSPASGLAQGDNFDIDYVAHELGHQLGGNHTFSHALENAGANMEPGSGSTIMGYAGITGATTDVQAHSDPYFHARSIEQIQANLIAKTCDIETNVANTPPTIAPLTNYSIPKGTAFVLTASATDAENDPLTYTWEQYDNATVTINQANLGTTTTGADFRSVLPGTSPTRYFPRLSSVLAGVLNNSNNQWESVSTVARTTKFRVTARDNSPQQTQQQTNFADVTLTVTNDGPFKVTSTTGMNNTPASLTWDVANTAGAPYNVANVKIDYTLNNGTTWTTLLATTPNDGSENVTFTGVPTGTVAKVRISAIGNVFYAVGPVTVSAATACNGTPPGNVNVSNISATTAQIGWDPLSNATYIVRYRVAGTTTWTTLAPTANTTSALAGLTPGTNYEVQVAAVCSGVTGTFSPSVNFRTFGPSPLPYYTDFNPGDFTLLNGTQPNKWMVGADTGNPPNSLYVTNDGVTNGYNVSARSVVFAYKDLIIPAGATTATFQFDWKGMGESSFDDLAVFIVPASYTPTPGTAITASATLIKVVDQLKNQATWTTYLNTALNISSFAGSTMRLVFQWRNDSIIGTQPAAAVDNVNILIPTCNVPLNPQVTGQTLNSFTISWTPPFPVPAQGYEYYYNTTGVAPTAAQVGTATTATTATITGLTPLTTYYWWVRAKCVGSDRSLWIAGSPVTIGQIGSGNASDGNLPIYAFYGYNYSQMIYTAAELAGAIGTQRVINKISFYSNTAATNQSTYKDWRVYLGNTTKSVFTSTSDWIPAAALTLSFDGQIPTLSSGQWFTITLDTPYIWDGVSNLVIAVNEYTPSWASGQTWGVYPAGGNRGIIRYLDTSNPTPANPGTANTLKNVLPRLRLEAEPLQPCTLNAPTGLSVTNITDTSALLRWPPVAAAGFSVQYRKVTSPASPWITITPNPTTFRYTLTGLTEQTDYEFRVANICGTTIGNYSAPFPFRTKPLQYCPANATLTAPTAYISKVTVTPTGFPQQPVMTNSSGASNYSDYYLDSTKLITLVKSSQNNKIQVEKSYTGTAVALAVKAWIDYNRNGVFEQNELIFDSPSTTTSPVQGTFNVPAVINYNSPYPTRMRIVTRTGGIPLECGLFSDGEVEDYAVKFVDFIPCNNTPTRSLTVTNVTQTTATVNWTSDPGGATYIVRWKEVGSPTWINQVPLPSLSSTYQITGLNPSKNYTVEVIAVCDGQQGSPASLDFATPCPAEPPVGVAVSQITSTSAQVSWNSVPTATYTLRYRLVGTTQWTVVNTAQTSVTLQNLLPYRVYEVQVATVCNNVTNNYSNPLTFTTLATCEMPPVNIQVVNIRMTTADVTWNSIPGASYILKWRKVGSNAGWNTVNVTTNTYTLPGLTESTMYEVQIANVCNGNTQAYSSIVQFQTTGLVYCPINFGTADGNYISNVSVESEGGASMSNSSNASTYTSYRDKPAAFVKVIRGTAANTITVTKQFRGTPAPSGVTAWIDFNRDGNFTNEERILISPIDTQTSATGTFMVPSYATLTTNDQLYTVMRVAVSRDDNPVMCGSALSGEVEDYRVIITEQNGFETLEPGQVNIYPNPATTVLNVTMVEDGAKYTIYSASGQVAAMGQIFNNKVEVNNLPNGVYVIEVDSSKMGRVTKKFIKN